MLKVTTAHLNNDAANSFGIEGCLLVLWCMEIHVGVGAIFSSDLRAVPIPWKVTVVGTPTRGLRGDRRHETSFKNVSSVLMAKTYLTHFDSA